MNSSSNRPATVNCSSCRKRRYVVVVRQASGHTSGYCAKCWQDDSRYGVRQQVARTGGVVMADNRKDS